MICSGMVQHPLEFGNGYIYLGVGEVMAGLIVGVPISFIFLYVFYRVYYTQGTLKEVNNIIIFPNLVARDFEIKQTNSFLYSI